MCLSPIISRSSGAELHKGALYIQDLETGNFLKIAEIGGEYRIAQLEGRRSDQQIYRRNCVPARSLLPIDPSGNHGSRTSVRNHLEICEEFLNEPFPS